MEAATAIADKAKDFKIETDRQEQQYREPETQVAEPRQASKPVSKASSSNQVCGAVEQPHIENEKILKRV